MPFKKVKKYKKIKALLLNSVLFDQATYEQNIGRKFKSESQAIRHYLLKGGSEAVSTSIWFDPQYYLSQNLDVKENGSDPISPLLITWL